MSKHKQREIKTEVAVRITPGLHRRFAALARKWDVSISQVVEWALTEHVNMGPGWSLAKTLKTLGMSFGLVIALTIGPVNAAVEPQEAPPTVPRETCVVQAELHPAIRKPGYLDRHPVVNKVVQVALLPAKGVQKYWVWFDKKTVPLQDFCNRWQGVGSLVTGGMVAARGWK